MGRKRHIRRLRGRRRVQGYIWETRKDEDDKLAPFQENGKNDPQK